MDVREDNLPREVMLWLSSSTATDISPTGDIIQGMRVTFDQSSTLMQGGYNTADVVSICMNNSSTSTKTDFIGVRVEEFNSMLLSEDRLSFRPTFMIPFSASGIATGGTTFVQVSENTRGQFSCNIPDRQFFQMTLSFCDADLQPLVRAGGSPVFQVRLVVRLRNQ